MRHVVHVAGMGDIMKNTKFVPKPWRKSATWRPRHRRDHNIRIDLPGIR